jgi:Aldo/keto reductase family
VYRSAYYKWLAGPADGSKPAHDGPIRARQAFRRPARRFDPSVSRRTGRRDRPEQHLSPTPLAGHRADADRLVLGEIGVGLGATRAQVALAWLLDLAPNILLIPGTRTRAQLAENLGLARCRARRRCPHGTEAALSDVTTRLTCKRSVSQESAAVWASASVGAPFGDKSTFTVAAIGIAMTAPTRPSRPPPISAASRTATEGMSTVLRITRGAR